ncbi:ABC transporter permease [Streptomyces sp900105245]|uniref:ABC transporter permease n=1 Tax=Streptomyces sp. 900105245 TaxID=3154379 RepID=A0ABV1UL80_9ACTN
MNRIRIVLLGGLMSYRALFGWTSPWILIPSFMVTPLAQILLFAYIGRSAGIGDDKFFVIGNALQYSAIPCLFGIGNTVVGERHHRTLGLVLTSPAPRLPLLLGRSLPVVLNGCAVAVFAFVAGSAVLGIPISWESLPWFVLAVVSTTIACTGLGLITAAFGLRFVDMAVLPNLVFGVLLVFSGANIPPALEPHWMLFVGRWLPFTHGIAAARLTTAGASHSGVGRLVTEELLLGLAYAALGTVLLRALERRSRHAATLEMT